MCKKTKDNQYRYYNANLRIILWTFALLLVFAIMCIIAAGISYVLYELIIIIGIPMAQNGDTYGFLSGLIGIVLGFLFDLIFINRIRQILKYKKLVKTVTRELEGILTKLKFPISESKNWWNILFGYYKEKSDENKKKFEIAGIDLTELNVKANKIDENTNKKINYEIELFCTVGDQSYKLYRWAFASIVTSAEYDYIILTLNKKLSKCLHYINGTIQCFNKSLENENRKLYIYELLGHISLFYYLTNYNIFKTNRQTNE